MEGSVQDPKEPEAGLHLGDVLTWGDLLNSEVVAPEALRGCSKKPGFRAG